MMVRKHRVDLTECSPVQFPTWTFNLEPYGAGRVSVRGVKSLVDHFACLCWRFDFYEVKKKYNFLKRKGKYFYTFNHFYSEKSSKIYKQNSTTMTPNLPK